MKKILTILVVIGFAFFENACSNDDKDSDSNNSNSDGTASITLTAAGEQFKITGTCGWASAAGVKYIAVTQDGNNLKTFSVYFNVENLPVQTTIYTLVADESDTNPSHITMNLTEITPGTTPKLTEWNSMNASGTLKLSVDGKKITANLDGIVLKPGSGVVGYINGNTGALASNGTLTGTLTLYKD